MRLLGAQIGGDLACTGGTFANLVAETAAIKGNLFWQGIKGAGTATLCLMNASVGAIADDEASWTAPGKLFLDGFVYERISAGLKDARKRLEWLARQEPFSLPPYRQLAKVLREAGDARGAREVLFQMERRRRQGEDRSRVARLWSWLLRWIIGYGLKPVRAVGWLVLLTVAGFAVFGLGYLSGTVTPTEKEAYKFFQTHGQPPLHYPRFNALVYSFEHSLPFVNLGQKDHWGPNPQGSVREPALEWRLFARLRDTQVRGVRPFRFPWPGLLHAIFWSQILQDGCSPRFSWPG